MEERWMGAQDSLDEKGVACVDGASQADGGFDHGGRRFMSSAGGLAARERSEDVDELTMADRG